MRKMDPDLHSGAIWIFLAVTFGLTFGIFVVLVLATDWVEAVFGPIGSANPLIILAVYAPAIAAFGLVLWRGGLAGIGRFLARLLIWRGPMIWYLLIVVGFAAAFYAGALTKGGPLVVDTGGASLIGLLILRSLTGPIEEFGWRGVLQPLLQRHMAPIWAGVVVGLIWGLWHLPAFFLSGMPQSNWTFLPFFVGAVAISVMVTAMFNAFRGSLLLPVLTHIQLNSPLFPDGQPYDTIFFAGLAVLVVVLNRRAMFDRSGAATRVIPES